MNLTTITTTDRQEARRRFIEYRDAVRQRHNDEDVQIMRGYQAMAQGRPLISLRDTIERGGLNAQGLPALAVAPSMAQWCYLAVQRAWHANPSRCTVTFSQAAAPPANARRTVRTLRDIFTGCDVESTSWGMRAMVPPVPPALRPARGLASYFTLFEVDKWQRTPLPPGDPALLRQIGGDLYAVVATWDLTELEKLVLAERTQ